jgi:hypothetical protein
MAVWSVIRTSEVSLSSRCDAEFFRPEFLDVESTLLKVAADSMAKHFKISDGNHLSVSRFFTSNANDIPYFRGQDLNGFFLENTCPVRIPQGIYFTNNMRRSHFVSEDVLMCIVGASTGTISMVPEEVLPATGSCKIGIFRRRENASVDACVLTAFLLGHYGQNQIKRNIRGTAQGGIILKDMFRLQVPLFEVAEAEKIRKIVEASIRANRTSKVAYDEAQQLLESELGLNKLSFEKPVGLAGRFSCVGLGKAFSAGRIDAQCFAPTALFFEERLTRFETCTPLSQLLMGTAKGRQHDDLASGSTEYCSIKHITGRELVGVSRCEPKAGTPFARPNDLLLAITGATIGKVGIVKRYSCLAFSGDLLRLRSRDGVDPHYLLLVLNHEIGQVQFNRWITGSTNGHLSPRDVGRVLIPRLQPETEEKIAALVENSLSKRIESEHLLEEAKTRVEQLIKEAVKS